MSRDIVSHAPRLLDIDQCARSPATVTLSSKPPMMTIMFALTVAVKSDGNRMSSRTNSLNPESVKVTV